MEEELKCPLCRRLLREPVLLHCAHSYCRECALRAQCKVSAMTSPRQSSGGATLPTAMAAINLSSPPGSSSSSGASCADTASLNGGMVDGAEEGGGNGVAMTDTSGGIAADATSSANEDALSETDSGVVIYGGSRGSRPSSFLGGLSTATTASSAAVHSFVGSSFFVSAASLSQPTFASRRSLGGVPSILSPSTSGYVLACEACGKPSFFPDENFLRTVKENVALRRLVARFRSSTLNDFSPPANASAGLTPSSTKFCQWCEGDAAQPAESYCETCGYFYCRVCRPVLHPPRGPLKSHRLVPAAVSGADTSTGTLNRRLTICAQNASETQKRQNAGNTGGGQEAATPEDVQYYGSAASGSGAPAVADSQCCEFHAAEPLTMYCNVCRMAICAKCLAPSGGSGGGGSTAAPPPPPSRHLTHDVQSLTTAVRAQKTELSQTLQLLSEKARAASEDIARLKTYNEKINNNCDEFKQRLDAQFQWLADALETRRRALHEVVDAQRERKRGALRGQLARCSQHLSRTTALIQFSIELLKETDPVAYMQVGYALANRVTNEEFLWCREMRTKPDAELAQFHLTLDAQHTRDAIQRTLDFAELKESLNSQSHENPSAPPPPVFETAECAAANNTVVLTWRCSAPNTVAIDGYSLEIDSGWDDGVFKEVYRGPNTACTIEGLHFNALYNARVRAFNCAGESAYSEPICLQTAPVVWFQLAAGGPTTAVAVSSAVDATDDDEASGSVVASPLLVAVADELAFSNEFSTVFGTTLDYRTCLATVGVSRGRHYWEVWVERRENDADVVVGVAQCAVDTRMMLGKDIHGWSMYVDSSRSWFLHNDAHHGRRDVGLQRSAAVIGNSTPLQPSVIGVLLDCDRGVLSFFVNDAPVVAADGARFAFNEELSRNMPRGLYYPAFSVNRNATITVHSALSPPNDGSGSL